MSNYSKYKDRTPEETVELIKSILNDIGLSPVLKWNDDAYDGAKSCRVSLYPTKLGTNGKGTDKKYSEASGFAELMERLNNSLITLRDKRDSYTKEAGFNVFPDEKMISIYDIISNPDPYMSYFFEAMCLSEIGSQVEFLQFMSRILGYENDMLLCVPFADPLNDRVVYLPIDIVHMICGSNGMAAGNTLIEAMVQGMSEVFERAASRVLLDGKTVPPKIPEEEIKKYSFYHLIEEVHREGKYRITLYDVSLDRGWPVTGLMISDLETGRFGFKLGAHPSFAVSIERTLTEALQGRNMEHFANICVVGSPEQARGYHNYPNVGKTGDGIYPYTMFRGTPDWEYRPWTRWDGLDNRGFLAEMLKLLKAEGFQPLFRDCSFLGFPSCFIVIPGFSGLFPTGKMAYRGMISANKAVVSFDRFPDVTEEEEKRILNVIRFKEYSVIENQIAFISGRQLSEKYNAFRIAAYIALKHGEYSLSGHYFNNMSVIASADEDKEFYSAMHRYCRLIEKGASHENALDVIKLLCRDEIVKRVSEDTGDISHVMQRNFPKMNCYDCANCQLNGTECDYPAVREVIIKSFKGMKKENASQEKLLDELKEIYGREY